jgi:adenylate cyclase
MTRRLRLSFTITLLAAFATLFLLAMGAVVLGFRETAKQAALDTAEASLAQAAEAAAAQARSLIRPVTALSAVLGEWGPFAAGADPGPRDTPPLIVLLCSQPAVQAVALGLPDGRLRQLLRLRAGMPGMGEVPEGAIYALREAEPASERWLFLDESLHVLAERTRPADGDHRQAQWFLIARDPTVRVSTLYDLPLFGRPGLSVSRRVPGQAGAVLQMEMTLEALAGFLAVQRLSANSQVFLFDEDAILLAHQRPEAATIALPDGRSTWTTLNHAADPLLRQIGLLYATGVLAPGVTRHVAQEGGGDMLVRLLAVDGIRAPRVFVAVLAPTTDFTGAVEAALRRGTLLAILALAIGLALLALLAWRIARPLAALTREAEAIRRLELDEAMPVQSRITEISRLAEAMGGMKSALRQFGVYVPRALVAELAARGEAARIGGERRPITVMFSDVQGFTTLAEGLAPEELMNITSHYFEAVTNELLLGHATIDKYIGDAVMAIWNAPGEDASHARNACFAALRTRLLTERLAVRFAARGWPRLHTRFGLHTGDAVVGNVGSTDRMSWTAIGSMVNLSARLEGLNKHYGTHILISEATRLAAGRGFVTRPVDLVVAKGATTPTEIHELLGLAVLDDPAEAGLRADAAWLAAMPHWLAMMAAWRAGDFAAAEAALARCPQEDALVRLYATRLAEAPALAGAAFSPVIRHETK